MKKNFFGSLFLISVFFLVGFFLVNYPVRNLTPEDIESVKIAGQDIRVGLALSEMEKSKGLSGRTNLKDDEGMLFVFTKPGKYYFWMKDMNFPIDIIWLAPSEGGDAEDMKVVYIKKDARPELYPETYGPDQDAKYVLEVNAGFSENNNLKEGDNVLFTY